MLSKSNIWLSLKYLKPLLIIYTLTITFAASQSTNCILDLQLSPASSLNCKDSNWDNFLSSTNCCGSLFNSYLLALGRRANQTGKIYLNSSDQETCLTSLKEYDDGIFACGIEKLTSGAGGCSDFSVNDVFEKYGDQTKNLDKNCRLESTYYDDGTCGDCVRSWENIRGMHFASSGFDQSTTKDEDDVCRFAVLISLTGSRINEEGYARKLYQCLGDAEENSSGNQASESKRKNKISTGVWIAVGSSILVVVIIVSSAAYILSKRYRKSNRLPQMPVLKHVRLNKTSYTKFSIKQVNNATNNLHQLNLIGEGTSGKVYKGVLSNNQQVAIKHIINDGSVETFAREVASLSHVRHMNLVALLGCCVRDNECFLIYELCLNGNLSEWLFGKDKVLSWIQRLEIAIGSAQGLQFLHTYSEGCIVHRDIKPTNILLGLDFEAKLSDFGLSKVIDLGETNVSSEVRGTFGYVDPLYEIDRKVNSSGDVYSFGIVLLQILSGKRVINLNLKKPMPLQKMAKALTRSGSTVEFADPKLEHEYSEEAFDLTLQLAISCTSLKQQRPSMEEVVGILRKALDMSTCSKVFQTSSPVRYEEQSSLKL